MLLSHFSFLSKMYCLIRTCSLLFLLEWRTCEVSTLKFLVPAPSSCWLVPITTGQGENKREASEMVQGQSVGRLRRWSCGETSQGCKVETDSVSCSSWRWVHESCLLFLLHRGHWALWDTDSHAPPLRGQPAHVPSLMCRVRAPVVWLTHWRLCTHLLGLILTKEWCRALSS